MNSPDTNNSQSSPSDEIISATLVVKSSRPGHISVFSPEATPHLNSGNLKPFYAQPDEVANAIKKLKEKGIKVNSFNQFTIDVIALKSTFEEHFQLVITANEYLITASSSGGSQKAIVVEVKEGDLSSNIQAISFIQPYLLNLNQISDTPPELKEDYSWALTPNKVREKLELSPELISSDSSKTSSKAKVPIIVIDTGFAIKHPYFTSLKEKPEMIPSSDPSLDDQVLAAIQKENQNKDSYHKKITDEQNKKIITATEIDKIGHGTMVLALLLATAPKQDSNIFLHKILSTYKNVKVKVTSNGKEEEKIVLDESNRIQNHIEILQKILTRSGRNTVKGAIFSCSFGLSEPNDQLRAKLQEKDNRFSSEKEWQKFVLDANIQAGIINGRIGASIEFDNCLFVFSSGNDDVGKNMFLKGTDVISVGGVYFNNDENKYYASNVTQGYNIQLNKDLNVSVPDVCGICGGQLGKSSKYLIYPTDEESSEQQINGISPGWVVSRGASSAAAPQVAGVCAIIKLISSELTTPIIKKILRYTATAVPNGVNYNGIALSANPDNPSSPHLNTGKLNADLAINVAHRIANIIQEDDGLNLVQNYTDFQWKRTVTSVLNSPKPTN